MSCNKGKSMLNIRMPLENRPTPADGLHATAGLGCAGALSFGQLGRAACGCGVFVYRRAATLQLAHQLGLTRPDVTGT